MMMNAYRTSHSRAYGSYQRRLIVLVAGLVAAITVDTAMSAVDYNKSNDYYAALRSGGIAVVDQYHLGPCQQRLRERDYPRAISECNFILKIFPNHPTALRLMSEVCEQWKSPRCILDDIFEKAISINPTAAATYVIQGVHFQTVKQYSQAIQSYRYALEMDPNLLNAHYNLALTYMETKQFDLANAHAQRAYSLGASLPGLRNRLEKEGQWKPSEQGSTPPSGTAPANKPAVPPASASGAK